MLECTGHWIKFIKLQTAAKRTCFLSRVVPSSFKLPKSYILTSSLLMLSISNLSQAHLIPSIKSFCSTHLCHLTTTSPSDHISLQLSPLLASLWFAFMYFKTKVLTVAMLRTLRLARTRFLTCLWAVLWSKGWPSFPILWQCELRHVSYLEQYVAGGKLSILG